MSKDYEVPREAILAAADAMGLLPDEIDNVLIDALEAAAPHMLAGVRERNYAGLHAIAELGSDDPAEPFRKATK